MIGGGNYQDELETGIVFSGGQYQEGQKCYSFWGAFVAQEKKLSKLKKKSFKNGFSSPFLPGACPKIMRAFSKKKIVLPSRHPKNVSPDK